MAERAAFIDEHRLLAVPDEDLDLVT